MFFGRMDLKWLVSALQNFTATLLLTQSVTEEWLTHNGMLAVKLFSALDAQMQARSQGGRTPPLPDLNKSILP